MSSAKFVFSRKKVLDQYRKVEKFADIVSYSSKTNSDVSKILEKETGCMFSVHLRNELKNIEDKSRIWFLAQAWDKDMIKELFDKGIGKFVIDNEPDLDLLVEFIDKNKKKADILLRVKLRENTIRTEKYFVFGMDSVTVNKRLRELRENNHIRKLGVHFHRKTQNLSEWNLKYEISNILDAKSLNLIDLVNIGGGLPSVYANTNEDVIRTVFDKVGDFKKWLNEKNIDMIIEPGRFIAAPAIKLITHIKRIYDNNIIVDASVYNTDMDALIVPVKLLVQGELEKGEGKPYAIKGKTPCSMDIFRYRVYLEDPKEGDKIVFLNAGAYNFSSDFCDLEKLETEVIE